MTTSDPVLVLREHRTEYDIHLTAEQADALDGSAARLTVRPTGRVGHYDVKASHMVGVVVAPGLRVVIRPKVEVDRLFYLLGYSTRTPALGQLAPLDPDADLLESLAHLYVTLLGRALARGLVREYADQADTLHAVRGRIGLLDLTTRRCGIWPPVPCEFTDHTADTLPNQLMLAAAVLLGRLAWRGPVAAELGVREARMDEVSRVRFPATRVPSPRLDRRHAHCEAAVRVAELVLRHMSLELRPGAIQVASFLVDMNALYEDFVVTAIGDALSQGSTRWARHPRGIYLDRDREIRLVPDAVLKNRRQRPVAVVDAKYKDVQKPVSEDIYQMSAYCTRLRIKHAVLVYASSPSGRHRLPEGVTVHRVSLGPEGDVETLTARVAEVAAFIESLDPSG